MMTFDDRLQLRLLRVLDDDAPFDEAVPAVAQALVFLLARESEDPVCSLRSLTKCMERMLPEVMTVSKSLAVR